MHVRYSRSRATGLRLRGSPLRRTTLQMRVDQKKIPPVQSAAVGLGNQTLLLRSPNQPSHLVHAAGHDAIRPSLRTSKSTSSSKLLPKIGAKSTSLPNRNLSSKKRKRKAKKNMTQAQRKTRRSYHSDISRKIPRVSHGLSYLRNGAPWTDHLSAQLGPSSPMPSDRSCCACKTPAGDESMQRPRFQASRGDYTQSLSGACPSLLPRQGLRGAPRPAATRTSLISSAP